MCDQQQTQFTLWNTGRQRLEELASSHGISQFLDLPGHVSDVPAFLQTLDLFVFPSDSA